MEPIKIHTDSDEEFKFAQEYLFSKGFRWAGNKPYNCKTSRCEYLFGGPSGIITMDNDYKSFFHSHYEEVKMETIRQVPMQSKDNILAKLSTLKKKKDDAVREYEECLESVRRTLGDNFTIQEN